MVKVLKAYGTGAALFLPVSLLLLVAFHELPHRQPVDAKLQQAYIRLSTGSIPVPMDPAAGSARNHLRDHQV